LRCFLMREPMPFTGPSDKGIWSERQPPSLSPTKLF
jgi:hypothetical protein